MHDNPIQARHQSEPAQPERKYQLIVTTTSIDSNLSQRAAVSQQNLADAMALVRQRETEVQDARDREEAVSADWAKGVDTLPASALTEAQNETARALALLRAAQQNAKRAERNVLTDTPDLARAVADALGTINGLPVQAVCESVESEDQAPTIQAVQVRPSRADVIEGSLSGEVELILTGPAYVQPLDVGTIVQALNAAAVRLEHEPSSTIDRGSRLHQSIALSIRAAHAPVPVIAGEQQTWRVQQVASTLAHQVTTAMQSPTAATTGVRVGGSFAGNQARTVPATAGESTLVSTKVDKDGVRRTTVRATCSAYSADPRFSAEMIGATMRRLVESATGQVHPGLGSIESARVLDLKPTGAQSKGRVLEAEYVFTSRQG